MKMETFGTVQQAVNDLALIRCASDRVEGKDQPIKARRSALDANLLLQSISLFLALLILGIELATDHSLSQSLQLSMMSKSYAVLGIIQVGITLAFFVMCLYYIVWRSARHGKQDFGDHVTHNFRYLRSISFVADLLIKFVIFSLLVLAQRPVWIPPLLALFVGDYLIQGRFFSLPIRLSLLLGLACFLIAGLHYLHGSILLTPPLLVFIAVNILSLARLIRIRRTLQQTEATEPS